MDATSAGMLLAALAASCRGEALGGVNVRVDRDALPRTPGPGEPALTERSEAPELWQARHPPLQSPDVHEVVPMAVVSHLLSQKQCAAIKYRMAAAAGGAEISTNDALLTELLLAF